MSNFPKVSIIIPVYNGKDYLKEAIDSALAQDYKNIEIIVVNDGSKDHNRTKKICSKYLNQIKYIEKDNGGVSSALNVGIKNMTGEYFSWLSHDDKYYSNKISSQINLIKKYDKKTVLYSNYDVMYANSHVYAKIKFNHKELELKPEYALLRGKINGLTLLIHKSVFDKMGFFDENLKCIQDYEYWYNMMYKFNYKFVHMKEILVTSRIHSKQTTNTSDKVVLEGNPFWIKLIDTPSNKRKIELEGTVYNYYKEMYKFLLNTPYDKAVDYVKANMYNYSISASKDIKRITNNYNSNIHINKIPSENKIEKYVLLLKDKGIFYCLRKSIKKIICIFHRR